ncbi:MAG: insulinase family protein, partial [Myxococcales bacterium]|nr:insulinase family protein [Myxococcales bacterium]
MIAAVCVACAGRPPPPPEPVEAPSDAPAVERALASGLVVQMETRPSTGAIAVQLWVPAGAMHAASVPGGSAVLAEAVRAQAAPRVAAAGGRLDVWVQPEAAVFSVVIAEDRLAEALAALTTVQAPDLSPAAITAAAARADAARSAAERDPERILLRSLFGEVCGPAAAALFPIEPPDAKALATLHARRYRPAGSRLVVVGAASLDTVADAAAGAFADWKGSAEPLKLKVAPPGGPVVRVEALAGDRARLRLGWPLRLSSPAEAAAADALAAWLGEGAESALARALARAQIPVARLAAFVVSPAPASALVVEVDVPAARSDAAFAAVVETALGLGERPPPAEHLLAHVERARRAERAVDDAATRARRLGQRGLRWPGDVSGEAYATA